jgi:hypothetical protein
MEESWGSMSERSQFMRLTFKIVNLRLKFLFPGSVVPQGGHDLVVVAVTS